MPPGRCAIPPTRGPPVCRRRLVLAAALLICPALVAATEPADWTVIAVLSGAYVDSLPRFLSVGSGERIHVLVLHDTGTSTSAYRVLPDPDGSHPPGECCPSGGGTCCDRALLPLDELGLTEDSRISEETLDRYLSYVQLRYPARRYLLTMRGHASETSLSINAGGGRVALPQLVELLSRFSARRGGGKLEVLNLGMCQTASTDWAYALAPWVDTFVGSANYTNPPVAMRWRMHLWVRELLRDPAISHRDLARRMVELFAATWDYCVKAGHLCSNASRGEPWTAVALDLSAMDEVAATARELVCEASQLADGAAVRRAVQQAATYGSPGWTRRDLAQFATNLAREAPGTGLGERALALRGAVEHAVLAHAAEPETYPADALGLAAAFLQSNASAAQVGPFQVRALWRPFLALCDGDGFPAAPEVRLSPPRIELLPGARAVVEARGFSPEYGAMCRLPGEWTLSPETPAALESRTLNPAQLTASWPGAGELRFEGRGLGATAEVLVHLPPSPQDGEPTAAARASGCASASGPAALSGLAVFLGAMSSRRRVQQRLVHRGDPARAPAPRRST